MPGHSNVEADSDLVLAKTLKPGIVELLKAFDYAINTGSDRWDFAVPIQLLRKQGLNESDLRWLSRKHYVEHAREVTARGKNGREFRPTGDLTFTKRTCFVLTESGVATARVLVATPSAGVVQSKYSDSSLQKPGSIHPQWDAEARELRLDGSLVKRFKWQAINQETVLCAFQEEDWPIVIDDPLPQKCELDAKRRLQDTIKALNRNQELEAIRFHGNGTGEGVRWEITSLNPHVC